MLCKCFAIYCPSIKGPPFTAVLFCGSEAFVHAEYFLLFAQGTGASIITITAGFSFTMSDISIYREKFLYDVF
ncbi:MAG: hypothetical protein EOM59_00310 [Clostridia bacterium]|nr:hypothetical protein [Clostridia bacterium]